MVLFVILFFNSLNQNFIENELLSAHCAHHKDTLKLKLMIIVEVSASFRELNVWRSLKDPEKTVAV